MSPIEDAAAGIVKAAAPAVIKTASGESVANGIWTLVVMAGVSLVSIAALFFPKWKKLLLGQRQDDVTRLTNRVTELEKKLDKWIQAAVSAHAQLSPLTAALSLGIGEIERLDPSGAENPVTKQMRRLVETATHRDDMFGKLVEALDDIKEERDK